MTALAIDHVYRYERPSLVETGGGASHLRLATSGGPEPHPHFFEGRLLRPRLTADLLRALSHVVAARYFIPPAMVARILAAADPVVTSAQGIRFEGFSGCCSAYARVDLSPDAIEGTVLGRGTTNVDFNPAMRASLARVRDAEPLHLAVGQAELRLDRAGDVVVEKKVALPARWLKGFVEVQACQSRMKPALQVSGIEARRFLRALPRSSSHGPRSWVTPAGRSLRLSQVQSAGAVRFAGIERLRVLEDLAAEAQRLEVYTEDEGSTAWVLEFGMMRFHLVLSPDVFRGFSGEGQVLSGLAKAEGDVVLTAVRAQLLWQAQLDPKSLAEKARATPTQVEAAIARLGTMGLVGYDLSAGAYFHRELPFDLSRLEAMHPRLAGARKLLAQDGVQIVSRSADRAEALVAGSGVTHRVRLGGEGDRCTCPWFSKHRGSRGPCKHLLAAQLKLDEKS